MENIKIKQTQDLDLTALILERKAVKQMVQQHGALWFILYELFVLEDSMTITEFKRTFILTVFVGLPLFLVVAYSFLGLIAILGGIN
jgi:hypothetical protein